MSEDRRPTPGPNGPSLDPRSPGRAVLMLHGILLNRWILWPMERYLRWKGYRTLNLSYPSTRSTIEELARGIAAKIAAEHARAPISRLDLAVHSMGGLVARRLLTHESIPPVGRLVQISPPNRGSAVARHWRVRWAYRRLYGTRAGWQLGEDAQEIARICGVPEEVEWGIVMGLAPSGFQGSHLESPHDGLVSHSEMSMGVPTTCIEASHTPVLFFPETWREVRSFIDRGRFLSEEERLG